MGDGGADDEEEAAGEAAGKQTRRAEMEAKLTALSVRPDLYELLARSLAPSIWEMEDVKKGDFAPTLRRYKQEYCERWRGWEGQGTVEISMCVIGW